MPKVNVKVKFFSMLASRVGRKEQELEVSEDLQFALNEINDKVEFPLVQEVRDGKIAILINGKGIKLSSSNVKLADNDTIAFLPLMGGG